MYRTSTLKTPLGMILLKADNRGLTSIKLPETFSKRTIMSSDQLPLDATCLTLASMQVLEYFAGLRMVFDLPVSLTGTPFQQQVWNIINAIPYGQTMSYGEIARKIGGIGKARAVGGAAHANPLPLIIPCHRVIGADGNLAGFAGGVQMKERLLVLEKQNLQKKQAAL